VTLAWVSIKWHFWIFKSYLLILTCPQVSGFGAVTPDGGPNSERLQVHFVFTADDQDCEHEYNYTIEMEYNFCTNNGPDEGFCSTDLGSPLVANGQLIGIANWNIPCALGYMDVYTRVSYYRIWISSISGV
jgi:secreted trypsin-like serine protease